MFKDEQGVLHFTDLPDSDAYKPYFTWPGSDSSPVDRDRVMQMIGTYSRRYGVDPALVRAVVQVESDFSPTARSKAGAEGLMQLMPETQQDLGVSRPFDARANIKAGIRYLRSLLLRFPRLELALAAYNAGPGRVQAYGGVPPFPETQRYVKKVLRLYHALSAKTREYVQSGQ